MREHRLRQVNTGIQDSLPLCLVDRHGEAEPNRELFPLELKNEHLIIRGAKGILGKKTLFPACWPSTISASMTFLWNPQTTQPRAIAKSVYGVDASRRFLSSSSFFSLSICTYRSRARCLLRSRASVGFHPLLVPTIPNRIHDVVRCDH
jgi:hypothetical protein